ncbi:SGNH/GDSL hydrolase family protein [Stappia sp. MMSF_3263]|uniref:SGNH/GDSL hydrolase family protein n=1 Tax=Stappia sp. MMSF_3263 TaxID=3046693 RepID=UPI00274011A7|nr:SGNH/GDSL hydrolase family protein [Stappia sp. MMSF_3263]
MSRLAFHLSTLALPLYAVAGLRLRARTHRFPPADGPVFGHALPEDGEGGGANRLRLLVLGDSSAAAVGIARQEDGLAPCIAASLARRRGCRVDWHAAGFNSATTGMLRDHVVHNLEPVPYSHILISAGFNDLKNFHSGRRFRQEFGGLIYALKARFPESRIYWSQVLAPDDVPALTPLVRALLRPRAVEIVRLGQCLCRERGVAAIPAAKGLPRRAFCADGIHPSEEGFAGWAEHVAEHMQAG